MSSLKATPTPAKVTHDEYLEHVAPVVAHVMEKVEQNQVLLGVLVTGKSDPAPKFNDQTGELYPQSYYLELSFIGGSFNQRVPKEIFESVEEGKRYTAAGKLAVYSTPATSAKGSDYIKSSIIVKFSAFHPINELR